MSAEEKSPLLSKDSKDEGEIPRPKVPVVDYSRKTFYDYLGLKSDASIKTIKSTYDELAKKLVFHSFYFILFHFNFLCLFLFLNILYYIIFFFKLLNINIFFLFH